MKKFILMVVLAVASVMIYAQPRAIGGRLGAFNGISYQHGFGDKNMLEVELGWSVDGRTDFWRNVGGVQTHGRTWGTTVQAAATYDWIDPFNAPVPWNEQGEWHWYLGVGGAGGYGWNANTYVAGVGNVGNAWNWGYIGAAGRIGIEYDFWFPLQLSLTGVLRWEQVCLTTRTAAQRQGSIGRCPVFPSVYDINSNEQVE